MRKRNWKGQRRQSIKNMFKEEKQIYATVKTTSSRTGAEKLFDIQTPEEFENRWYKRQNALRGDQHFVDDEWLVHSSTGPAIVFYDGSEGWFINGQLHRTDGPALNHKGRQYYWLYGQEFLPKEYQDFVEYFKRLPDTEPAGHLKFIVPTWKEAISANKQDIALYMSDNGTYSWIRTKDEVLHNLDAPSVFRQDGSYEYWQNGFKLSAEHIDLKAKLNPAEPVEANNKAEQKGFIKRGVTPEALETSKEVEEVPVEPDSEWKVPLGFLALAGLLGAFGQKKVKSPRTLAPKTIKVKQEQTVEV